MGQLTRTRRFAIWTSIGTLSLAAVSCGSDNNSSTDTAARPRLARRSHDARRRAATTASGSETTTAGTDAGGGSGAGTPETMEQLLQRPTKITNTTPIGATIPKGKNIMWIQCSVPACVALGKPLKEATDALGWNLKIVSHDGTPEGVKAAYEQAVREKPDGVVSSGYPSQIFATELQQLAAANIPVIQVTVTDTPGGGLTAVVNGPPRNAEVGRQLATYVAGDSNGAAKALWATSTFPILVPELEGFQGTGGFAPTLKEQCPNCTYDKLEIPIEALATEAPSRMVSYLQAHPDVNYVVGAFGDIVSDLPGALADAGLANKVKVVTYSQNATLSSYLKEGQIQAIIGFPGPEDMWQVADTFARIFAGVYFEASQNDLPELDHHEGHRAQHHRVLPTGRGLPGAVQGAVGYRDVMSVPAVEIDHLTKTFPGQRALDDVTLSIRSGEVHGLLGENGSGKSTLIKVLSGFHAPDRGTSVVIHGEQLAFGSAAESTRLGLRFVHQNLGIIKQMSAVENVAMTSGFNVRRGFPIRLRRQAKRVRALFDRFGVEVDLWKPLGQCRAIDRTIVAIVRALDGLEENGVLVLDEPTAALPPAEVDHLFDMVREVTRRGVTTIYVSHRLDEVFRIVDRVSVLRDGVLQGTRDIGELDQRELVRLIVGSLPARYDEAAVSASADERPAALEKDHPG